MSIAGPVCCRLPEEPMSHVVALAQAEAEENPKATPALREFGGIRPQDAEKRGNEVLEKHRLTAPIRIDGFDLDESKNVQNFPYIKFSTWVEYLLTTGKLPRQLCACVDLPSMKLKLAEFWFRYESIYPMHQIFAMRDDGLDLSLVIPVYSHTDEGRSYKKQALWLLSTHGAIGRGTRRYLQKGKDKIPLKRCGMGLNFCGHTWSTNFLFAAMLRKVFKHHPQRLDTLVSLYAQDMEQLLVEGVAGPDGVVVRCCHIGTKGDLPALCKMGNMKFSFSNVARQAKSKKPCAGICWMCCAGQEDNPAQGISAVPFEDTSGKPVWEGSLGLQTSWDETPPILAGVPLLESEHWTFFKTDLWHNFHLGLCKHWVASSLVSCLENWPLGDISMDEKVAWLGREYKSFCLRKKVTPHCEELGRDTLNWLQASACPVGAWNKGSASTHFMLFLEDLCDRWSAECAADPLLQTIAACLHKFGKLFFLSSSN